MLPSKLEILILDIDIFVHFLLHAILTLLHIKFQENIDHLLETLLSMLNINDMNVVTCVAGILSNLTCNNQSNKLYVFRSGGIATLIRILFQYHGKEEIIEPAVGWGYLFYCCI